MAVQLPVVLALLTMAVYTPVSEGIFTFPPRPSRPPGTLPPLRCDSVLVQNNPDNYPHCWCTYRQWTDWKYVTTTANTTCASNQSHTLRRTRSSLSSRCPNATQSEVKYICELNTYACNSGIITIVITSIAYKMRMNSHLSQHSSSCKQLTKTFRTKHHVVHQQLFIKLNFTKHI